MDAEECDMMKINNLLTNINEVIKSGNLNEFKELIKTIHEIKNKALLQTSFSNAHINIVGLLCERKKKPLLSYLLHQAHVLQHLTSSDAGRQLRDREEAFYKAMCANHFPILEMLYDHWTGDVHWLGHRKEYDTLDVEHLNQLNILLKSAYNKYKQYIKLKQKVDSAMYSNIRSLIAFSDFQKDLYTKLNDLKSKITTWRDEPQDIVRIEETYALRNIILTIIDAYENHQKIVHCCVENYDIDLQIIEKTNFYFIYEVYFRKLDSNICLLLLDNLYLLKQRLKMPTDLYQILENELYQFNYHVTTRWRLYLPKRKLLHSHKVVANYEDVSCSVLVNYDRNKFDKHIYTIFLIRRDFEEFITDFRNELRNRNITDNIIMADTKMAKDDVNSLSFSPELRDDYSLKKMSQHISQLHSVDVKTDKYAFLLIERTLQIVGEFLKCADESVHLQPTTAATLQAEISVEVVEDIKSLRDMLCHAEKAKLLKIIDLETNNADLFETIRKELLFVKTKIDAVIDYHKPFLEMALILKSLVLLVERQEQLPDHLNRALESVFDVMASLKSRSLKRLFAKELSALICILGSINSEAVDLWLAFQQHSRMLKNSFDSLRKHASSKFPFYRDVITHYLEKITDHMIDISTDRPNSGQLLKSVEKYWLFILCLVESLNDALHPSDINRKLELRAQNMLVLKSMYDFNSLSHHKSTVIEHLDKMQVEFNINSNRATPSILYTGFEGITELRDHLLKANFLTTDEKKYLITALLEIVSDLNQKLGNDRKKAMKIYKMIHNIRKDIPITLTQYRSLVASTALHDRGRDMLKNLAMGNKRDPLLATCLRKRVCSLRELVTDQSKNRLVQQYNSDKTFRAVLEGVLFDIFDILKDIKTLVRKSNRLFTEISLRNLLTHGSPLLEVVGDALDANDLPTELVSKALVLLEDERAIVALCALIDSGFDFNKVNGDALAPEDEASVVALKSSPRWKGYLQLVPQYKRILYEERKSNRSHINDTSPELVRAVYENDPVAVQAAIDGGAHANSIDDHKAAMHHAAAEGCARVMEVLLKNGADVDIRNEESQLTALHYAAMHGFKDAVELLLKNGADCFALDGKGRTPVYLATQRKHNEISRILLQAMKKVQGFGIA